MPKQRHTYVTFFLNKEQGGGGVKTGFEGNTYFKFFLCVRPIVCMGTIIKNAIT